MTDEKPPESTPTIPENRLTNKNQLGNLTAGIIFDSQEDLDNYRQERGQEATPADSPINRLKSPTSKTVGKKASPPKKKNSKRIKQGAGLNKIKQDQLVKWTVHVQEETRAFVGKAVIKAGLTQTDWIDSRLQQAAREELGNKPKPPAKAEDVADLIKGLAEQMKADQAATAQAQTELIQQQMAELAAAVAKKPATLKEMIFGKSKAD